MKFKKLIALASSIAMVTTVAISSAAYAENTAPETTAPEVSLSFAGYEKKGAATFAKVNVDLKVPETLAPYELKAADWETTFEDTYSGFVLQGLAIEVTNVSGLAYVASLSTVNEPVSATLGKETLKLSYLNADAAAKGYSGDISKNLATLWFRITDASKVDATYEMNIVDTVVGYNYWSGTSDSTVKATGYTFDDFTVKGCTIKPESKDPTIAVTPSPLGLKYGETKTLTAATTDFDGTVEWTITEGADVISIDGKNTTCDVKALKAGKAKIKATAGTAETTVEVNVAKLNPDETIIVPDVGTVKFLNFAVVGADDSSKHINITKGEETRSSAKTIGEILNGEWSGTVNANIAIGVITADAADAFTFEIK